MKTYVCKRMRMYTFLTKKGFEPYKTCVDKFNCNRLVWLYDDSDELQQAITEYYLTK